MKKVFKTITKSEAAKMLCVASFLMFTVHCGLLTAQAQTTEFTYQGRLLDSASPPTANYDFEFSLWDASAGGTQQGTTLTTANVTVTGGIFTVRLDFGAQFDGSERFLQIAVRVAGGGTYTPLAPRQPITSGPYAIRSLNSATAATATNALNLGGVPASQYVITTDARMSDARDPMPGSGNYIQNQSASPQSASNFNISGTGTANVLAAATQYNIGANRILGNPGSNNLFAGVGAGTANTTGASNSFFGRNAGMANTTGNNNSFFGSAGVATTTGSSNAFFGQSAGGNNVSGFANTLLGTNAEVTLPDLQFATAIGANASVATSNTIALGRSAGQDTVKIPGVLDVTSQYFLGGLRIMSANTDNNLFVGLGAGAASAGGQFNSFFGSQAGLTINNGFHNSFFGASAGRQTTGGIGNSFFGSSAGEQNVTGERNSFFGYLAGSSNTSGFYNAFFAAHAGDANTTGGQNAFFGYFSGGSNTTSDYNAFYGSQSGRNTTTGGSNAFVGAFAGFDNLSGSNNAFFGRSAGRNNLVSENSFFGAYAGQLNSTGVENSFFGYRSGDTNTTGSQNSFFGYQSGFLNTSGESNTFVGRRAGYANQTSGGNSFFGDQAGYANTGGANSFFGASAGRVNTTGILNAFFGHFAGDENTIGSSNSFFGRDAGGNNTSGNNNVFIGMSAGNTNTSGDNNTVIGYNADVTGSNLQYATAIGAGAVAGSNNQIVLGRNSGADVVAIPGHMFINNSGAAFNALSVGGRGEFFGDIWTNGTITVFDLGTAGSVDVCRNNLQELSTCSSSLRYKNDVKPFYGGLDVVRRLRPILFRWNDENLLDVGFGAEDVEKVEPLLVTRDANGTIEGVKYKQITTVLVNAINEQQRQIEAQQKQIVALKNLVCAQNPTAEICKEQ